MSIWKDSGIQLPTGRNIHYTLSWIFLGLWVMDITLNSSCLYIISWKTHYSQCLSFSLEVNITTAFNFLHRRHVWCLWPFLCPLARSSSMSLHLLINREHWKIHISSISAQEMPSQNRHITPWLLHVIHLLIHPRLMFTLLITALCCWLTLGHVFMSFIPT